MSTDYDYDYDDKYLPTYKENLYESEEIKEKPPILKIWMDNHEYIFHVSFSSVPYLENL